MRKFYIHMIKPIVFGFLIVLVCTSSAFPFSMLRKPSLPETVETDEQFLDLLQYTLLQFFLHESNEKTGLVKDRANNFQDDNYTTASIASVGFALPAYVIGAQRGWLSQKEAYRRVLNTLSFFKDYMEHENGFYYHFVNMHSGKRVWWSEVSSIDTALFMGGVLFVRQYYTGTEIETLATELYERINWQWMLNGGKTFSMGWRPTRKGEQFLSMRWQDYNENMILYVLGIGSPTHPVPARIWDTIHRPVGRYGEHILIYSPPLFTHQYSHAFIDFRNKRDAYADYFENSIQATLANREFCIDNSAQFKTYSEQVWGLTSCDGPGGYKAYGAKPGPAHHDGTVAPSAAGGSIVFAPTHVTKTLRYMYDSYKDRLWGRYGFSDSFNLDKKWFSRDVIGIDQGIMLLMVENYRTGLIWKYFMQNPEVQKALTDIGFVTGSRKQEMPKEVVFTAWERKKNVFIDGDLSEWEGLEPLAINAHTFLEFGQLSEPEDFSADLYFLWDKEYLFIAADVTDDDVYYPEGGKSIYKNDCLELFFDPHGDGLLWGNAQDIQLGLSPDLDGKLCRGRSWEWFHHKKPLKDETVSLASRPTANGYVLEAAVTWEFLDIVPAYDAIVRISPAFHDYDGHDETESKMNVFFQDLTGKDDRKKLAIMKLMGEKF